MVVERHSSSDSTDSTPSANRDTDAFPIGFQTSRCYSSDDVATINKLTEQNSTNNLMEGLVGSPVSFCRHDRSENECPGSPLTRAFAKNEWWLIAGEDVDFGDEYDILGEGSISVVFKAQLDGEVVAVKVLRTDHDGARDEAGLPCYGLDLRDELSFFQSSRQHPNILEFKGAGSVFCMGSVVPFIAYEFLAGSVEDLINQRAMEQGGDWQPPKELGLSWSQQLFSALKYLHTCDTPYAHRDLKPANLLLSADLETLKLADFSLATPLRRRSLCEEDCTTIPSLAGSFRYMAPEVAKRVPFDLAPADVYSATITAWSLIHGRRPYDTIRDAKNALSCVCGGLRPVVKDDKLRKVLEVGWNMDPRLRPSAEEMEALFAKLGSKKTWSQKIFSKVKKTMARTRSSVTSLGGSREASPTRAGSSRESSPLKGSGSPLRGVASPLGFMIRRSTSSEL